VFEVVAADPDLAERARELFESGSVELYRHDEGIEPQLITADWTTMFLVTAGEGAIQGLVIDALGLLRQLGAAPEPPAVEDA